VKPLVSYVTYVTATTLLLPPEFEWNGMQCHVPMRVKGVGLIVNVSNILQSSPIFTPAASASVTANVQVWRPDLSASWDALRVQSVMLVPCSGSAPPASILVTDTDRFRPPGARISMWAHLIDHE
jgi:hypothetical protein